MTHLMRKNNCSDAQYAHGKRQKVGYCAGHVDLTDIIRTRSLPGTQEIYLARLSQSLASISSVRRSRAPVRKLPPHMRALLLPYLEQPNVSRLQFYDSTLAILRDNVCILMIHGTGL